MKVVILAGGFGTRISEESHLKPKPMIEIGGMPILWHIMKIYSHYGLNDFIICLGYKGYIIKEYFANYYLHMSDITFDMSNNDMIVHHEHAEPWKVTLVDTGLNTKTGGRIQRVGEFLYDGEDFCMTYGDGLADIHLTRLIKDHQSSGRKATLTAIMPPGRFGALDITGDGTIENFKEKPKGDGNWINGGFFVLDKSVLDYIDGPQTPWETTPLQKLAREGELGAYKHEGFWQAMDHLREKIYLEELWENNQAPWKVW